VNPWLNTTVTLNDSWGAGPVNILQGPLPVKAEFSLRPLYLRDAKGVLQVGQFQLDHPSGFLDDGWQQSVFTPRGTNAVTGISGLPPWDPSQAEVYRDMIDGPGTNLGDSGTLRLEGVIPFLGADGSVGFDVVRLYYVVNAVQGGPIPDLVVVKTAPLIGIAGAVQALQQGSGQGPPH
jgi:hypothetical protein